MRSLALVMVLLASLAAFGQSPQTSDVSNTQPLYAVNAKYVNGIAPGYWPTAGSGLTLNISKGTCFDSLLTRHTYVGGTLTMTNSTTNYVVLSAAACTVSSNTSGYGTDIPIATVVTSGGNITSITDDRTNFAAGTLSAGTVTSIATMSPITGRHHNGLGHDRVRHVRRRQFARGWVCALCRFDADRDKRHHPARHLFHHRRPWRLGAHERIDDDRLRHRAFRLHDLGL
jgi:hypothetical protein